MRYAQSAWPWILLAVATASCTAPVPVTFSSLAAPPVAPSPPPVPESRPTAAAELMLRYDRDRDGRISMAEYPRADASFRNLDRNRDGTITKADFDIPVAMPADLAAPFLIVRRFAGPEADAIRIGDLDEAFENVDADRDGAIDRSEFTGGAKSSGPDRFLPLLSVADADHDGRIGLEELKTYARKRDMDGDGSISRRERTRPGPEPKTGWFEAGDRERAPDFTLPRDEGDGRVTLSSFAKQKPVALIFGSFT